MPIPKCPSCKNTTSVTFSKGPGRLLSGYALTPNGAALEIPEELEIPICQCGTRIIDNSLGEVLQAFELSKVGVQAFPIL